VNRNQHRRAVVHDAELRPLGRIHGPQRALDAIRDTLAARFRTSVDLILAFRARASRASPSLWRSPSTAGLAICRFICSTSRRERCWRDRWSKGGWQYRDDEQVASLYGRAIERLAQAGLAQYEIRTSLGRPAVPAQPPLLASVRNTSASGWPPIHLPLGGDSRTAGTSMAYIDGANEREIDETLGEGEIRRETIFLQLRQTSAYSMKTSCAFAARRESNGSNAV